MGFSSGPEGDIIGRGFLWENGVMYDLNALFDDPGDKWQLTWGYSINDRSEIVGFGSYQGISRGFLLTPKHGK